jgi:hypothetical protein
LKKRTHVGAHSAPFFFVLTHKNIKKEVKNEIFRIIMLFYAL